MGMGGIGMRMGGMRAMAMRGIRMRVGGMRAMAMRGIRMRMTGISMPMVSCGGRRSVGWSGRS
jgi:hypothetical protein